MEGEEKREDRPYSKEEILAMEQKKDKHPSVLTMSGPIQSGFIQPEIILPSYEEMNGDELLNGPGPMETQTDPETIKLEQSHIMEDGTTIIKGLTVECTQPDPDTQELHEYLMEEIKPLHTKFILENKKSHTCPVFFGSYDNKQFLEVHCTEMYPKVIQKWGTLSCFCGLVPRIKLSHTPRNMNKVFLCCEKSSNRCNYFQWIHEAPKSAYVPKSATRAALKKRFHEMVKEMTVKRQKVDEEIVGGFTFP